MNRSHKLWCQYVDESRKSAARHRASERAFARYARTWLVWYDNKGKKDELQRTYSRARSKALRASRGRNENLRRVRRMLRRAKKLEKKS